MTGDALDADADERDVVTIYLAGPIGHANDNGENWREEVQRDYPSVDWRDPLAKYNIPADELEVVDGISDPDDERTVGVEEIVETDKQLIAGSDAVLVGYEPVRSIGTPMEVIWAYERDYPIALCPTVAGVWQSDLSPWYRYHVDTIAQRDTCVQYLVNTVAQERVAADGGEKA